MAKPLICMQVRDSFGSSGDAGPHITATVACFLIQEGANMSLQNKKGLTPLQACSPEVISMVMTFRDSLEARKYDCGHTSSAIVD